MARERHAGLTKAIEVRLRLPLADIPNTIIASKTEAPAPSTVNERCTADITIHLISLLICRDAQLRSVEPDPHSLFQMDRVVRALGLAELLKLMGHVDEAAALVGRALQ
jgi:hypothetical protein